VEAGAGDAAGLLAGGLSGLLSWADDSAVASNAAQTTAENLFFKCPVIQNSSTQKYPRKPEPGTE
jgi:hypothetical protein